VSPTNKEMQLRKTCQLYVYLLESLSQEVPEYIQECADSYDDVVNSSNELAKAIEELDSATYDRILNNTLSQESCELAYWWEMRKEADRLSKLLITTCI